MATPTHPTVTSVMNKVGHALNREHDVNPRSHKSRALWKLHRMLYPAFVREYEAEQRAARSPTTPQPSEPEPMTTQRTLSEADHARLKANGDAIRRELAKAPAHITRELHEDPPGTTPEELATIVAEETERAEATAQARAAQTAWLHEHEGGYREDIEREMGEDCRSQWDQIPTQGTPPTDEERKAEHERWLPLHERLAEGPTCNCAAGQSAAPLWHLAGCPLEPPPDD